MAIISAGLVIIENRRAGCLFREGIAERGEEFAFRRPVGDGEDNVGEGTVEVGIEGFAEIGGGAHWIVVEGSTPPGTKHQGVILIGPGDGHNAVDALSEELGCLIRIKQDESGVGEVGGIRGHQVSDKTGRKIAVWRGTGDETQEPGALQR